nr:alpha/beta hydrolase fold domain-containing protein [Cognatishimia sp. F0-27]
MINAQLRVFVKPRLRRLQAPERARRELDAAIRWMMRQPPGLRHLQRPGGLHWFGVGATPVAPVILYFHGGGYVAGSPQVYAGMLGRLSKLVGLEICAPEYRLAPEHPAPAAFDDACAAWARLMALGYRPDQIVLGGDSAGGGLALALLAHLCQSGTPPACAFAFSPWTDLTMSGDSLVQNRDADPLFPVSRIADLCDRVRGALAPDDPRLSPLYAAFPGCPPVLLHWGATEILRADGARMAERLAAHGARVETREFDDVAHGWQLLDGWQPEARESLFEAARFIQSVLADNTR